MIGRWEDIADRTSDKLGIPREKGREIVERYATMARDRAIRVMDMEVSVLGLGGLRITYGKAKRHLESTSPRLDYLHRALMSKYKKIKPNISDIERLEEAIREEQRVRALLGDFIEIKKRLYDAYGTGTPDSVVVEGFCRERGITFEKPHKGYKIKKLYDTE